MMETAIIIALAAAKVGIWLVPVLIATAIAYHFDGPIE
jgi:hypothetical protein